MAHPPGQAKDAPDVSSWLVKLRSELLIAVKNMKITIFSDPYRVDLVPARHLSRAEALKTPTPERNENAYMNGRLRDGRTRETGRPPSPAESRSSVHSCLQFFPTTLSASG